MATINGTTGNDTLHGTSGDDTISGGDGNDTLYGAQGNDTLKGGSGADTLAGGSGNDLLDGGIGADVMRGDVGDDTYVVDNTGDQVVESSASAGTDRILSSISFALGAYLENLTLTGSGGINGTGNGLVNTIVGNSAANVLDGRGGADTLEGGNGNDTYVVDNIHDHVIETSSTGGNDLVRSSVSFALGANVERLTLLGSASINGSGNGIANILVGNNAANVLDGGGGADTLKGGGGGDTYIVDNVADQTIEGSASGGTDLVRSSVTFKLATYLDNLTLLGTNPIDGTGNGLVNTIVGNSAANTLDGKGGADTLRGGAGDDTYIVDNTGDHVIEDSASGGRDLVKSYVSFALSANVEDLTLLGVAANATGNSLGNIITGDTVDNTLSGGGGNDFLYGGDGRDILDGGPGADTMHGGLGVDTYYVDNLGDNIIEESGTDDSAYAMVSVDNYVLPLNVDEGFVDTTTGLTLTDNSHGGILTGNIGDDTLIGQSGGDELNGGLGLDKLYGGDGNDDLRTNYDNANDLLSGGNGDDIYRVSVNSSGFVAVVTEYADQGHDTVDVNFDMASSYTLPLNVEDGEMGSSPGAQLHGNAADNALTDDQHQGSLYGGDGNDTLTGGAYMYGEDGNDTLIAADVDTSFVGGAGDDTLTGGAGNDAIDAGTGNDTVRAGGGNDGISGGQGVDSLTGGSGNDTFIFDNIDESPVGAFDTVHDFHSSFTRDPSGENDVLDFSRIDANTMVGGDQSFTYIGSAAFDGNAGELRADVTTGSRATVYHYYGDVDGDGAADFELVVDVVEGTIASGNLVL